MSTTPAEFESLQSDLLCLKSDFLEMQSGFLQLQKVNLLLKSKTTELESEALDSKSKATVLQSEFLELQKVNLLLNSKTTELESEVLVLNSKFTELQSEMKPLSLDRSVALAVQSLLIFRGIQPLANVWRQNTYVNLAMTNRKYQATLATVFKKVSGPDQLELSEDFDRLQDHRNANVHPSDPNLFRKEVHEMLAIMDRFQELEPPYATSHLVLMSFDALVASSAKGRKWQKKYHPTLTVVSRRSRNVQH